MNKIKRIMLPLIMVVFVCSGLYAPMWIANPIPPGESFIKVSGGCGSQHCIGETLNVTLQIGVAGYYVVTSTAGGHEKDVVMQYYSQGTHVISGKVGEPEGEHILTLYNVFEGERYFNDRCNFYAVRCGGSETGSIKIWTDKTSYCIGDRAYVYMEADHNCIVTLKDYTTDGRVIVLGSYSLQANIKKTITGIIEGPEGIEKLKIESNTGYQDCCSFTVKKCGGCENGFLWIYCNEYGYDLYVDGQYRLTEGSTGNPDGKSGVSLSAGTHTIKLEKKGCDSVTKTVYIDCGETKTINVTMNCGGEEYGEVKFRGTVIGLDDDNLFDDEYSYLVKITEILKGTSWLSIGEEIRVEYLILLGCHGYVDNSIDIGDKVEVYGELVKDFYGMIGKYVDLCPSSSYYIKKVQEEPLEVDLWVDKGCGSTYDVGDPIKIYFEVNKDCYITLTVTTSQGTKTNISNKYVSAGTHYTTGTVGEPTGEHKLTIYASVDGEEASDTCKFYARGNTGSIKVIVKDNSGNRLKGASIYLDGSYKGSTNYNGELLIEDLSPENYTVKATKSGYEDSENVSLGPGEEKIVTLTLWIEEDEEKPTVEILSPKDGETVSGKVTIKIHASDNVGVKKLNLIISDSGHEVIVDKKKYHETYWEYTWDTSNLEKGEYTIHVTAEDEEGNADGVEIEVTVGEGGKVGSIKVIVKDQNGNKVEGVSIWLEDGGFHYKGETNYNGELLIEDLDPGDYTVSTYWPNHEYEDDSEDVSVGVGETKTVTLTLKKTTYITISAVGQGASEEGTTIYVEGIDNNTKEEYKTNSVFSVLPVGKYKTWAETQCSESEITEFELTEEGPHEIALQLKRKSFDFIINVLDPYGVPISGALVDMNIWTYCVPTNDNGQVITKTPNPPVDVVISAYKENYKKQTVEIQMWEFYCEDKEITIHLPFEHEEYNQALYIPKVRSAFVNTVIDTYRAVWNEELSREELKSKLHELEEKYWKNVGDDALKTLSEASIDVFGIDAASNIEDMINDLGRYAQGIVDAYKEDLIKSQLRNSNLLSRLYKLANLYEQEAGAWEEGNFNEVKKIKEYEAIICGQIRGIYDKYVKGNSNYELIEKVSNFELNFEYNHKGNDLQYNILFGGYTNKTEINSFISNLKQKYNAGHSTGYNGESFTGLGFQSLTYNKNSFDITYSEHSPDKEPSEDLTNNVNESLRNTLSTNIKVLVGGPLANLETMIYQNYFPIKITNEHPGKHKGVIEVIDDPFGEGKIVLLAGSDREGTKAAVEIFKTLEELPDKPIIVDWNNGNPIIVERP